MGWLNGLYSEAEAAVRPAIWRELISTFAQLLSPLAPFVTEAVWRELLGQTDSVHQQPWPSFDPALAAVTEVTVVVQVNGKLRGKLVLPAGTPDDTLRQAALAEDRVAGQINGRAIQRVIIVPDKLVNIVVS